MQSKNNVICKEVRYPFSETISNRIHVGLSARSKIHL